MSPLEALLLAMAPSLAKLLETALADNYDQDAELQAILNMQKALSDQRVARALAERKT